MKLWIVIILLIVNQCQGALLFNGSDSVVDFGDRAEFDSVTKIGVMLWVNMDPATESYGGIVTDLPVTVDSGWCIIRNATGSSLLLAARNGSVDPYGLTPAGSFSSNAWHHLVMQYDGTGSLNADRLKCYIDGVNQALTFGSTIPASTGANTAPLIVGSFYQGVSSFGFSGYMDDLVIVTGRVFTDNERAIHRQSKVRRLVSCNSHMGLDGYPHGLAIPNGSVIQDDGPNQFTGLATNCVAAASLFMSYP